MTERSPAEAIFFAALDKATTGERTAFLDEACAGDEHLRRRVERLLAAYMQVGNFLERPIEAAANVAALAPPSQGPRSAEDGLRTETPVDPQSSILDPRLDFLAPSQKPGALGRLGHYEVLAVVGKGGMGMVLRAFDEKLHRVVAIKALAPQLATTGSARQRFVREARAAAAVTHDNVIAIHAVEDAGPVPYLVMQYIDGCTLQEKLDRTGPLPLTEILRIGLQVAKGLAAAHRQGLVHRDVKPANILLENGIERIKITDFGLARAVDDASLTQSGVIAGTPAYMSPEQAGGEHVDHRSDLFSLGSVLYTLCAGHAPFRASTTMAVLKRVCEDAPRPLREANPDVPSWLTAIIAKLHAKSPAERYQTAAEVAELLGRHLAQLQQPSVVGHVANVPDPQARWKRVPRIALLLLLGLAVLGASVVGYWSLPRRDETEAPSRANGTVLAAPPWKPRPPLTPAELAKLPSPLDALKREALELPENAPPEMVAVLGERPRFRLPERTFSHWMAQTSDGRLLAVPCGRNILLYDTHTGTLLRTLSGHTNQPYRPVFSPDGKRLASGSGDYILRVWDVATGQEELTLKEHRHWIWSVAYDPEGKRLVSADAGGTIKVWDAQGQLVKSFTGHAKGVNHLAFSPDGKRLATASLDDTCKIWDTDNWQEVRSLQGMGETLETLAWSRDGKLLAAGDDAVVVLWSADTYEVLHALKAPGKGLVAFTPDGRTLLTGRHDCSRGERHAFTRWDVAAGTRQTTCELPTSGSYVFFHLSSDGRTVFVSQHQPTDARVRAYDAETGEERSPPRGHRDTVLSVAVSPDGRTLASGGADRTVRLWDLAGWQPGQPLPPARTLEGHTDQVGSVGFNPDGALLASGGGDGRLCLWDVASGRKVHDLAGHSPLPSQLSFSPDGKTVAAGGQDGTVNRWDVISGQPKEPWRWHVGEVRPVAYSPDGRWLASGGKDGTVQLLEADIGHRRHAFRGDTFFTDVAFSSDGRTLAAVNGPPHNIHFWDLETRKQRTLTGHTNAIFRVVFHPTGRLAATASADGTVRLWDATPPGKQVQTIDLRGLGEPQCVAFTPEGRYLAVGLRSGAVALLRVP
jgi:WD40 repeat protein/serine/threonine protein kinase